MASSQEMSVAHLGTVLKAAGYSHPGLQRSNNEDRYHYDPTRGIFIVIDGVGGRLPAKPRRRRRSASCAPAWNGKRARPRIGFARPLPSRTMRSIGSPRAAPNGRGWLRPHGRGGDQRRCRRRSCGRHAALQASRRSRREADARSLAGGGTRRRRRADRARGDAASAAQRGLSATSGPNGTNPTIPTSSTSRVIRSNRTRLLLCSDGLSDSIGSTEIADVVRAAPAIRTKSCARWWLRPTMPEEKTTSPLCMPKGRVSLAVKKRAICVPAHGAESGFHRRADRAPIALTDSADRVQTLAFDRHHRARRGRRRTGGVFRARANRLAGDARLGFAHYGCLHMEPVDDPCPARSIHRGGARRRAGTEVIVEPANIGSACCSRTAFALSAGYTVARRFRCREVRRRRIPRSSHRKSPTRRCRDSGFSAMQRLRSGMGVSIRNAEVALTNIEIAGARGAAIEYSGASGGSLLGADLHDNPGVALVIRGGAFPRDDITPSCGMPRRNAPQGRC